MPLFNFLLALEVQKSQRLRYCVSVVCLQAEVPELAQRVIRHVRSTDVIVEFPRASVALLLINAEPLSLPGIVHRLVDQLRGFVPEAADLAWSAGGAIYPQTASGAEELIEQAKALLVRAREDGGNRLYVPPT
jgi:GGDEF domain-containing protein